MSIYASLTNMQNVVVGTRFGRWTVLADRGIRSRKQGHRWVLVRCDCGKEKEVRLFHLQGGGSRSCGCYSSEAVKKRTKKHGMSGTVEYNAWQQIIQRC